MEKWKYFEERKQFYANWKEIESDNWTAISNYDPDLRFYAECIRKLPIKKKVLYESGTGDRRLEAITALFEGFLQRPDFKEYTHIWVLHKKRAYRALKKKYAGYENVEFWLIQDETPQKYYELLATAAYLFHCGHLSFYFVKRQGQFFLNIRELVQEKPVGFENEKSPVGAAADLRSLLLADAVLVKDKEAYERLNEAFRLKGIYEGNVLIADAVSEAENILRTVLEKKESVRIEGPRPAGKKKVLIYGSAMATNGVTEALLALLKRIDYDKYDVTLSCRMEKGMASRSNIDRVDRRVRILVIKGMDPMTKEEQLMTLYLKKFGVQSKRDEKLYEKSREVIRRCAQRRFGFTSFDYAIDYAGYAAWIALLLLEVPAKKRLIWEHQALKEHFDVRQKWAEERQNVKLEAILFAYSKFDRIVAVNEPLMKVNKESLGTEFTKEKFRYVTNLLDGQRLDEKTANIETESVFLDGNGKKYLVYDSLRSSVDGTIKMLPFEKREGEFNFVTMGRLVPEKNHENLIQAFDDFSKEYPGSRLFIIGKGNLMEDLQGLAAKNKLEKNVIFTGNLTNPYLLMKHCDCFVFPSYYEGQGLVVLEARVLGMPIVMSNYTAAASVCVENGQYMIGMEKEDILEGLLAYARGEVPKEYHFDLEEYNQKSMKEFYQVLED